MKRLALLATLLAAAGFANVGCSASGSIRPTDTRRPDAVANLAYTTAPTKAACPDCPACPACK